MHVAMHNWMRAEPIEVTIARLAKCGYDAIEISGEPEKYDTRHVGKLHPGDAVAPAVGALGSGRQPVEISERDHASL